MESVVALNKENLRRKKRKSDQANGRTSNGKKSKTLRETAHQVQSLMQLPSIFLNKDIEVGLLALCRPDADCRL